MIEENTVYKDTFTNIFSYQVTLVFCKISVTLIDKADPRALTKREDYWIPILKTKAPMGLNVEGGYRAPIWYSYCPTIFFPGFGRLVLGLLSDYSVYCYFYFVWSLETVMETEFFMGVVNDVSSVTIAIDSSFLVVRNSLLIIIIFADCYCYYL